MKKQPNQQRDKVRLYQHSFKAMGTPCSIQLYATRPEMAKQVARSVTHDIQRLESKYSRYREDSFLSEINRTAARGGQIEVDPETVGLLNYAATCHQESDGLFDITSGILRHAWDFKSGRLPEKSVINRFLEKVGWQRLHWEPPMLGFPDVGMELDLGGVVKEYATDRAFSLCWEAGIRYGMINLGGDVRIIGPHADGTPWRVGIRHPRDAGHPDGLLQTLLLSDGGLASSGDYERCITVEGIRYGHILNPKTGWPVKRIAAVSVLGDLCVIAGSASTIGMLKEDQASEWLDNLGLPHLWVSVEGETGGSLV